MDTSLSFAGTFSVAPTAFGYRVDTLRTGRGYGELKIAQGHLPPTGRSPPADLSARPPASPASPLSRRQREIIQLLAQGQSNKQIARALGISEKTVKVHVSILLKRLGVTSRTAAAIAGLRLLGRAH